jgi:arylsulfatase A-like enzyme
MLGQILAALEQTGQAGNTLVIATGDNGAEKRPYPPLRDSKRSIYEGGHRVPFVASWPGKIAEGSLCDETICLNDLFATCAEIVGADLPDNAAEDSLSFLPCLLGESISPVREGVINQSGKGDLAIRDGNWKAVFRRNNDPELYDLENDLGETTNVASQHGQRVAQMKTLLETYLSQGRSTPGEPQEVEYSYSFVKSPARAKAASSGKTKSKNRNRRRSKKDADSQKSEGKN